MLRTLRIPLLLSGAIFGTSTMFAIPITYTMGFSTQSGIAPTGGSFTYDSSTNTFSSFTVNWDGDVWNLTSSANNPVVSNPPPACLGGASGAAAAFAMLSGSCYLGAVPGVSNTWFVGPPPQGQTTEKLSFLTDGSSTTSIGVYSNQNPMIPSDTGAGQWRLQSEAILGFQGGTAGSPYSLPGAAPVSQVTATISGQNPQDYYVFEWGGGDFSAAASITGASSGDSYLFSYGSVGSCNSVSQTLNAGDSFTGTIMASNLAPGQYCIGLDASGGLDPNFSLTFNTPVEAVSTPEPATFVLLAAGLFVLGLRT